jgi:hypothetical protein
MSHLILDVKHLNSIIDNFIFLCYNSIVRTKGKGKSQKNQKGMNYVQKVCRY